MGEDILKSKTNDKQKKKKKDEYSKLKDGYSKINNGCLKLNRIKTKAQRQGKSCWAKINLTQYVGLVGILLGSKEGLCV
jgi:hypothetical protein